MTRFPHLCYLAIPMTGKPADSPHTVENRISALVRTSSLRVLRLAGRDPEANAKCSRQLPFSISDQVQMRSAHAQAE